MWLVRALAALGGAEERATTLLAAGVRTVDKNLEVVGAQFCRPKKVRVASSTSMHVVYIMMVRASSYQILWLVVINCLAN